MSERLTKCPSCGSVYCKVLKILDPDTHDMNSRADLECEDCGHTWEGKTASRRYKEDMARGFII